jgi:hypothetical protein
LCATKEGKLIGPMESEKHYSRFSVLEKQVSKSMKKKEEKQVSKSMKKKERRKAKYAWTRPCLKSSRATVASQ